jgi:Ni2+-binding GTPase involved in maturation of urease and hydrogenase
MPPKKKQENIPLDALKVINFYDIMPKHLLNQAENPNFHLHNLKLPFRMAIVAPSGSGKTNFLLNLIHLFSVGKGTFADINVITRNKKEPLYDFLASKSDQIQIKEGLESLPQLDKFNKELNHLVVLDDLVTAKDQSMIENYYIRARKLNVSVIYISQSYFRIPKMIRQNLSYLVLLKLSGEREIKLILSEGGLGVDRNQLLALYDYATSEKFNALVIDYEVPVEKRYRRNWLEYLAVNKSALINPFQYDPANSKFGLK